MLGLPGKCRRYGSRQDQLLDGCLGLKLDPLLNCKVAVAQDWRRLPAFRRRAVCVGLGQPSVLASAACGAAEAASHKQENGPGDFSTSFAF
jgi:hypothetical protein